MAKLMKVEIKQAGKKWASFAGVTQMSRKFKTLLEAEKDLENHEELYNYWANSAGTSCENTTPEIIYC